MYFGYLMETTYLDAMFIQTHRPRSMSDHLTVRVIADVAIECGDLVMES